MSRTVSSWKLEGAGFTGGCGMFFIHGRAKWNNIQDLIPGLQRAVSFSEYGSDADSDVYLHKCSVAAVCFNQS